MKILTTHKNFSNSEIPKKKATINSTPILTICEHHSKYLYQPSVDGCLNEQ